MSAPERVRRRALELRLEPCEEGLEEVEHEPARLEQHCPDLVLHEAREDDRTPVVLARDVIDPGRDASGLLDGIDERYGLGLEPRALELLEQTVAQRLDGHARLVRDKKHFMYPHCLTILH